MAMAIGRRLFAAGLFAACLGVVSEPAEAKGRSRRSRARRGRSSTPSFLIERGTTGGECPCNGGKVCVGPRGGRYCITRSGNKRYGV